MKTLLIPALALLVAAPASADSIAVRYDDLALNRAAGMVALDTRLAAAAAQVCSSGSRDLAMRRHESACRAQALADARSQARRIAAAQFSAAQLAAGR